MNLVHRRLKLEAKQAMFKVKGVLFDYGHTLVYFPNVGKTHLAAAKNVQRILRRLGFSVSTSRIQTIVGHYAYEAGSTVMNMEGEFTEILRTLRVKQCSPHQLQEIIQAHWRPYIQKACVRKGVKGLLKHLKKKRLKLGIVANIWSSGMNPVLERFDLKRFFDTTVASVDVGFKKPDPKIFQMALGRLKLGPEDVIMVGDNPRTDIQAAHDIGMRTVRLMRGPNRTKPDMVGPDLKIRNFSTLFSIIRALT